MNFAGSGPFGRRAAPWEARSWSFGRTDLKSALRGWLRPEPYPSGVGQSPKDRASLQEPKRPQRCFRAKPSAMRSSVLRTTRFAPGPSKTFRPLGQGQNTLCHQLRRGSNLRTRTCTESRGLTRSLGPKDPVSLQDEEPFQR